MLCAAAAVPVQVSLLSLGSSSACLGPAGLDPPGPLQCSPLPLHSVSPRAVLGKGLVVVTAANTTPLAELQRPQVLGDPFPTALTACPGRASAGAAGMRCGWKLAGTLALQSRCFLHTAFVLRAELRNLYWYCRISQK